MICRRYSCWREGDKIVEKQEFSGKRIVRVMAVVAALLCCGVSRNENRLSALEKERIRFAQQCFAAAGTERLISPFGLNLNLAVLACGSAGNTRREFCQLLPCRPGGSPLVEIREVIRQIGPSNCTFSYRNELWYDASITRLKKDFLNEIQAGHGCEVRSADFSDADADSSWLVFELISTLRFEDRWQTPFEPDNVEELFYRTPGQPGEKCSMMVRNQAMLAGYEDADWQSVWLPFQNGGMAMLLLKPRTVVPVRELGTRLTAETIIRHVENRQYGFYLLRMPKFQMQNSLDCRNIVQRMGCKLDSGADFSNLYEPLNWTNILSVRPMRTEHMEIARMIQNNEFEIDEIRARGQSETTTWGVGFGCAAVETMPMVVESFTADRPFVFILFHMPTKSVLFIGSYAG